MTDEQLRFPKIIIQTRILTRQGLIDFHKTLESCFSKGEDTYYILSVKSCLCNKLLAFSDTSYVFISRWSDRGLYEHGWQINWDVLGCLIHDGTTSMWNCDELVNFCRSSRIIISTKFTDQWEDNGYARSEPTADVFVIRFFNELVLEAGISNGGILIFWTGINTLLVNGLPHWKLSMSTTL